jgi:hypothetical protein
MQSYQNLIYGGWMSQSPIIKTRSDSPVFNSWISRVDQILSQVPVVSANFHMPLEYGDDEFQEAMNKLQQCAMYFENMPIYPINESIASKLIYDQLQAANDKPDY